jgi:hypothetical protein
MAAKAHEVSLHHSRRKDGRKPRTENPFGSLSSFEMGLETILKVEATLSDNRAVIGTKPLLSQKRLCRLRRLSLAGKISPFKSVYGI